MSKPGSNAYCVLAVDDESAILRGYSSVLVPHIGAGDTALGGMEAALFGDSEHPDSRYPNIKLETRSNGADAIEAVRMAVEEGRPYSIVYMDVRMPPGMNGVDAATEIRSIDADVEIVFVTAYADFNAEEKAQEIVPIEKLYFINKPFEGDHMWDLTIALCQKWSGVELSNPRDQEAVERASFANRPAISARFPQLNEVLGLR